MSKLHNSIAAVVFHLIFLAGISFDTAGKETPKYVVNQIPAELRQNVNAFYWEDKLFYQIHARNRATMKVTQAITIFNENAKNHAMVVVGYDKLSKIIEMKGVIYDANGFVLKKLKQNEIYDQSAFDGFSLFSDNRLKSMNLTNGNYPYTVEFEYVVDYRYLFFVPDFILLGDEKIAAMNVEYTLTYPQELKPRFQVNNITKDPEVSTLPNGVETISWKFNNIKPVTLEPFSPARMEVIPSIHAAPTEFEFSGYSGSMASWDSFGQWISTLNNGRNVLPQQTIDKLKSITDEFPSKEEKIMATYEYLQSKTRYVSIQLGIGGFQPFEASVVDQVGYGDCKALSNYMVSLLSTIGIKSHYVLVRAGDNRAKLRTNFPSSQFNHAIVCVPMEKDTIWLECTSQTNPFGYMGSSTGNRKALAITDKGAVPVNTPRYTEKENVRRRTANVEINLNGDATGKVTTTYSGIEYELGNQGVLGSNFDEQKKWLQKNIDIPVFDIKSFSIKTKKEKIPSAIVQVDLQLNRLATVSGKRLFIQPNLMNRSTYIPPKVEQRKTNVILSTAYTHLDTINYIIPEQIYPEHLPDPIRIESRFGSYEASFSLDQGKVVYTRKMVRKNGEFPPETYQEFIDFYKNVAKADNTKIIFLNKT